MKKKDKEIFIAFYCYGKKSKKIAEERHKYLENFLKEFFEEWNGKR